MSTLTGTVSHDKGVTTFIQDHPLVSYFVLAYAGMWIVTRGTLGFKAEEK